MRFGRWFVQWSLPCTSSILKVRFKHVGMHSLESKSSGWFWFWLSGCWLWLFLSSFVSLLIIASSLPAAITQINSININLRITIFPPPARWGSLDFQKGVTPPRPPPSSPPSVTRSHHFRLLALWSERRTPNRQARMRWSAARHLASSRCCAERMSNIMPKYMPERVSEYICHIYIYFQMVCQKLCQNSVSGWESLEVKQLEEDIIFQSLT